MLLLIPAFLLTQANAQVTTTTVDGTVYLANGSVASGTVLVSWPAFSTAAGQAIAAGSVSASIASNGFVSVNLAPNAGAYPAGTYYTAVYHLSDGTVSREYWTVPAVATTTIAAVRAQLAPATVAVQPVSKSYVDDSLAAITSNFVPMSGGTMTGALQLSGDPVSADQAATKHYVDTLAETMLPLTGGSVSGALNMADAVTKLPKVDVRDPDFGAGCANAADPMGRQDSTCAIEAAVAWAVAHQQGSEIPDVYLPAGTYKISSAIRIPCQLHFVGDGPDATILEQTNNSANGITVYAGAKAPQPDMWDCQGSIENLTVFAPGGHLYTATLIELDNAVGYTLFHVRGANSGGRGLAMAGSTERLSAIDTEWDTDRWPVVATGNELKFLDTQIASPGEDQGGYCYGVNCINGVFPSDSWTVAQQLVSASGNGTEATYVVKGGSDSGSTNGISPMLAGNYFTTAGITGTTGLNGVFQIASVANNTPASGEYTVTAANTANGMGTVTGSTYKPTLLPDNTAGAFYIAGAAVNVLGGSIKTTWFEPCFETSSVFGSVIQGFYCEGFPVNGQPHEEASILVNGLPPWTTTTGPIASNAVPVKSTMWFSNYVNDPNDVASVGSGGEYRIFPSDYVKGSTSPSTDVPGVEQGQYENVMGVFSGDGQFHITQRNDGGSTAPANTAWPVGSVIAAAPQSSYGTLQVSDNHFASIDPPGSNWAVDCDDATALICGEAIVGSIPNGYSVTSTAGAPSGSAGSPNVAFNDDEWWGTVNAANENAGEGFIKISTEGNVTETGGMQSAGGLTSAALNGQYLGGSNVYAVQEADGSYAWAGYSDPTQQQAGSTTNGPFYEGMVDDWKDPVLGGNPGSGFSMGRQFANSECWYDVPPAGQSHALNRWCMKGGPGNTGANAGFEYDTWNGTAWVNAFGLSAQSNSTANVEVTGALAAAKINGEVTVDGSTYTTVNAAWNAAAALANSTGKGQTVRLGPGEYNVSGTMDEPTNGACVNLIGSGGSTNNADSAAATTLNVPANINGDVFFLGNTKQAQGCTFRDFVILANANATHGFEMQWFRGLLIDNVAVNDTTAEGILLGEESTSSGHQSNFILRDVTVSYSPTVFTPANRPAYGVHLQKTAMDSYMDDITVRDALTAAIYNEGTGNTGYLIHGFGYPYTCATAPCVNNATSSTAADASYATSYVIDDVGGGGSEWTDTYADSPAVAGFYIGANGVSIHGGHIQWPDLTSFPQANLAYVAANVTNNMLIADISCLGMASDVNWITYAGTSGNPPTFSSVHNLTGCGNYVQDLNPAEVTGFSSGGANINDPSGAVPRVWSTPIAAAASYPAYAAQLYTGYQGDAYQAHFSGVAPFFNVTYQGTIRANGGIALSTVINTASTLTLTTANRNVIANTAGGPQTITLPSCYTPMADRSSPTGLELTVIKSDASSNAVTLDTVSGQQINYQGVAAPTLAINSPGKRTLICGPDYNWYAY